MKANTYKNETVLIVRDTCEESFLTKTPKTVIDAINHAYFADFDFCGVERVRGWGDLDMCAAYKSCYGWTLYCAEDGKLDKILRPKVTTNQH